MKNNSLYLTKIPLILWFVCILIFTGIFSIAFIKNIQVELSNPYVIYMILTAFCGTVSFGIWAIVIVYRLKDKEICNKNWFLSGLKILLLLIILPLFLLGSIFRSGKIFQKIKIFLLAIFVALPVWAGWYFFVFKIIPNQICSFVKYSSMAPFGFPEGTKIIIVPFLSCGEGDVCAFRCLKNKCKKNESYLKNVEKRKKDKYWLTGRKDEWECNDVEGEGLCYSLDSSSEYGWVEDGKDVHIEGRVIKNPFQ